MSKLTQGSAYLQYATPVTPAVNVTPAIDMVEKSLEHMKSAISWLNAAKHNEPLFEGIIRALGEELNAPEEPVADLKDHKSVLRKFNSRSIEKIAQGKTPDKIDKLVQDALRTQIEIKPENFGRAIDLLGTPGTLKFADGTTVEIYNIDDGISKKDEKKAFLPIIKLKARLETGFPVEIQIIPAGSKETLKESHEEYKRYREAKASREKLALKISNAKDPAETKRLTSDYNDENEIMAEAYLARVTFHKKIRETYNLDKWLGYTPNEDREKPVIKRPVKWEAQDTCALEYSSLTFPAYLPN